MGTDGPLFADDAHGAVSRIADAYVVRNGDAAIIPNHPLQFFIPQVQAAGSKTHFQTGQKGKNHRCMPAGERNYDSTGARAALSNSSVVLRMASTPALAGLASGASVICSCKTVRRFMILAMSRRSFISGSTPSRI